MSGGNDTRTVIVKNEFDHSYLLFSMEENEREEYSYHMLSQNTIRGLLNCSIRYIQETPYFSYDISSKKSLFQKYSDKQMSYGDLKELFHSINQVLKNAAEFLLEKEGFILEPEYIFIDLETDAFCCIYLPVVSRIPSETRYRKLADFLLDKTDHKDEHAVNVTYQFYKMSKEEFFSFEAFTGFMEKEELMLQAKTRRKEEKASDFEEIKFTDNRMLLEPEQKELLFHWKMPCVLTIAGAVLIGVYFLGLFSKSISFYFLLSGLTITAVSVILWGLALYGRFGHKQYEDYPEPDVPVTVEEYFDDMLDNETVYFDEELTLRLKWKEGHFSKEYALTSFPMTVGKWKESVQICIGDDSVSRLHARFTQQDDAVILQDLDSTNGPRVNGKRLAAGEEAVIRRNDEIQFGKIIVNVV